MKEGESSSISALITDVAADSLTQGRVCGLCRRWLQTLSLHCFGFLQSSGDETDKWGFDGRKKDTSHFVLNFSAPEKWLLPLDSPSLCCSFFMLAQPRNRPMAPPTAPSSCC